MVLKTKNFLKRHPRLFSFFYFISGAVVGKNAKQAISHLPRGSVILNIGSGIKRIREDVINIDSFRYENVSVVADANSLPFKDNYADAIIAESLLEHLEEPSAAVKEFYRVLKPDGILYIVTPFIMEYHSSPGDYQRWTLTGLRKLLDNFEEKEAGVIWGPTLAFIHIFSNWLALILSFGNRQLHQLFFMFFALIFAPLSIFDYILAHHPSAENIAHGIYFIGIKK